MAERVVVVAVTSGGLAGMAGQTAVTSGGDNGTSGEARARRVALIAFAVVGLGFAIVNALSELDERSRMGRDIDAWEPWAWELTSLAAALLLAPLVFRASLRLAPPCVRWSNAVPLLLLLAVAFSVAHSAAMIGLRHFAYWIAGETYRGDSPIADILVYEFRKDLLTYALLLLLPHLALRLIERRSDGDPAVARVEVRDGARTVWLAPAEIDWAQAAGNYVELHGRFGTLLHRRTLAALEAELAPHGFARIHRSRIVRSCAIASVETKPSGDFEVNLASGESLGGSRRFRSNLA